MSRFLGFACSACAPAHHLLLSHARPRAASCQLRPSPTILAALLTPSAHPRLQVSAPASLVLEQPLLRSCHLIFTPAGASAAPTRQPFGALGCVATDESVVGDARVNDSCCLTRARGHISAAESARFAPRHLRDPSPRVVRVLGACRLLLQPPERCLCRREFAASASSFSARSASGQNRLQKSSRLL